ncbi:MAG: competence/damage-inducible protein A [Acidobacteria bacterium]|nr:competence/damage-inducible protein A [Acidobacteriota bacterium]
MLRKAEIIAVGTELLTPHRLDTNSLAITERLNDIGIDVRTKAVVGDDRGDLQALFVQALERADLIVLTGGLGPTDDDLTREVVADVLQLPLEEDPSIANRIRGRFERRGLRMPDINRRQAMVPRGAKVLDNPNGTAPGLILERGDKLVVLLPGPPREMKPMLEIALRHHLEPRSGGVKLLRRILRVTGRTESHVEEVAQPVYGRWSRGPDAISTTILASPGQIELHLTTLSDDVTAASARLERAVRELMDVLGADVFSVDGRTLEQVVGALLRDRHIRLALAESCTGGLTTSRLTDVPGSSDYVERGIVCYSNRSKVELLGVPATLIETHGAVSEEVALEMARGIRDRAGVDMGVAITGIAGPGGGREEKPVGTVFVAAVRTGEPVVRRFRFPGSRDMIKSQAAQAALDLVRRTLRSEK